MGKQRISLYLSPMPEHDGGYDRALWADREGFDDIWFPDGYGMRDAMTFTATCAATTQHARLCTGVVPVYTRPAAILASSALAINAVAPGRFVLGLGSSTKAMVEGWYGETFTRPLQRVRETVEVLRRLFDGQKSRYQGDTIHTHGFKLAERIQGEIPIYLAAMGPKMLELVGEVADGVILNHFTPLDRLPFALEHLDIGAKRSGRRVEDLEIAQRVCVWVTDHPERAHDYYASDFSFYGSTATYQNIITLMGYPDAATGIRDGFAARDRRQIMAAVPDEAVERLYVWGDEATCQARVREFYAAGVDNVVVAVQATDRDDFDRTCRAFTRQAFDATTSA
jgi:probable F420-dependent oxidoreductase